jgi:predicted Zn-dependent protease
MLLMFLALSAAGCNQTGLTPTPVPNPVTGQNPGDVKYYPSDQPVRLGIRRFYEGNFGLAQQYFQDAVEKSPRDATAWTGLAASYDRLGRFDLADRAYAAAAKLESDTASQQRRIFIHAAGRPESRAREVSIRFATRPQQ